MRNTSLRYTCLLAGGLLVCLSAVAEAAPPPLDIPLSAMESGLLSSQQKQAISDRVAYWFGQIETAEKPEDILAARLGLRNDFRRYDFPEYNLTYARQSAAAAEKLLAKPLGGRLGPARKINAALALAGMPQVPIQPVLDKLVADDNPAIRYIGWEGYQGVKMRVLAQRTGVVDRMLASMKARAQAESEPPVLSMLIRALYFPSRNLVSVDAEDLARAQKQSAALVDTIWGKLCQGVIAGDLPRSETARKSLSVVAAMAQDEGYVEAKNEIMQNLIDAAWCAAKLYDRTRGEKNIGESAIQLLNETEAALNAVTGRENRHIVGVLADRTMVEKGAAVQLAVLKWIDELKKDYGVKQPAMRAPATTRPAAESGS